MSKVIIEGFEARKEMLEGIEMASNVVGATAGPGGGHVIIDSKYGAPRQTRDGVTVAKNIGAKNPYKNIGAQLVKIAATKTNDVAGDGTTTTSILIGAIASKGMQVVSGGMNPPDVQRGIEKAVKAVLDAIEKMSKPVTSFEEMEQVATVSANGDAEVGRKLAEAYEKVGKDGVVTVEEANKSDDFEVRIVQGMNFDRGYLSPYFVTDAEKMQCEMDNPYILIVEKKISNLQQILPLLESIVQSAKPLVIIAEDVEGEALATLILNKLRGGLKVAAVKAPGFGDRRKAMLQDIALVTGGMAISEDLGHKLENINISHLGRAKKVIITKDDTTIVDGMGEMGHIKARATEIRGQIDSTSSEYDREKLQERLAKLTGGVAVIRVGGETEMKVKELKDRVDDASHATKAAIAEGIVPGGGTALLYAANHALRKLKGHNPSEQAGIDLMRGALSQPCRRIIDNAGLESSLIVATLLEKDKTNNIYDVRTQKYVDAYDAGIIDPTKVVRTALKSAASTACVLITTAAIIIDEPENDNKSSGGAGGMGGMGDMSMGF
ncbi:MAG: chaperonin GroEL [Proteobacteria bacterium]|nr:chaperonin GroEL [Pseudomonadota bacterium]